MQRSSLLNWGVLGILVISSLFLFGFGAYYDRVDDDQLVSAIKTRLKMDPRIHADRIVVRAKNGHVILSGVVDTVTEKVWAEGLVANSIVGVKSVTNNIEVRPAVIQDDAIKKQVEEMLENTPALYGKHITVSVKDGVVKLEGKVGSILQRRAAEEVARLAKGVKAVTNLLIVKPTRPDRDIEKDVAFYLLWSPIVDIDQVDFTVEDGVVMLKGEVEHHAHVQTIEQDLEKIEGVVAVDVSGLEVKPRKSRAQVATAE